MQKALCGLLVVAAAACGQEKVVVDFYAESLCPGCDATVKGPINNTLSAQGISGIMDFTYYPFGNAYVKIEECKYDPGFGCWNEKCGSTASSPPADCYTGDVVCQHGKGECYGNLVETCVKNMTGNDAFKYMPFVYCFESNGDASPKLLQECAPQFGLSVQGITECMNGAQGKALTAADAKATAMVPDRDYVPYLVVNGKVLKQDDLLLHTVCSDWKGTKPPGCHF